MTKMNIVVGCEIAEPEQKILVATENGYGKQTDIKQYRMTFTVVVMVLELKRY